MRKIMCIGRESALKSYTKGYDGPVIRTLNGLLNLLDEMDEGLYGSVDEIVLADCDWDIPDYVMKNYNVRIKKENKVCIISEIGDKHKGNVHLAADLIVRSANAGCDMVKLQTVMPSESYAEHTESYKSYATLWLSIQELRYLKELADNNDITLFSTPGGPEALKICIEVGFPIIKISSGMITHIPFIKECVKTGLPLIISTGMSDIYEVETVVDLTKSVDTTLLHCTSLYPPKPHELNLSSIRLMKRRFENCTIGYSDHTNDSIASCIAVAMGARVIEKHYSEDIAWIVQDIREAELMVGDYTKKPCSREALYIDSTRRFIVAAREIQAGEVITEDDIGYKRINSIYRALPPNCSDLIIGRTSMFKIKCDDIITEEDVE